MPRSASTATRCADSGVAHAKTNASNTTITRRGLEIRMHQVCNASARRQSAAVLSIYLTAMAGWHEAGSLVVYRRAPCGLRGAPDYTTMNHPTIPRTLPPFSVFRLALTAVPAALV